MPSSLMGVKDISISEHRATHTLSEVAEDENKRKATPHELTPKSWTPSPTKGVLFYEQVQYAVQVKSC